MKISFKGRKYRDMSIPELKRQVKFCFTFGLITLLTGAGFCFVEFGFRFLYGYAKIADGLMIGLFSLTLAVTILYMMELIICKTEIRFREIEDRLKTC